jgi:hypothetical protein
MADDDRTLDANARKNLGQELCLRCCRPGRAPRPLAVAKAGPVDATARNERSAAASKTPLMRMSSVIMPLPCKNTTGRPAPRST